MAVMLLEWVFTSVFLILVVLAVRTALGKRMSAGLRYALWAVVLVRLLVPVQLFTSPIAGTTVFSEEHTVQNVSNVGELQPSSNEEDAVKALGGQAGPSVTLTAFPQAPNAPAFPDAPEPPDLSDPPAWLANLGWVWLVGSAAVALVFLLSNLRFAWRLRRERIALDEVDLPLRVYVATGLPSPCLFGIVRPAIYVTPEAAADPAMLRHVLAHEYTHCRHGDHMWSLLRCTALAVHWWNPLVWLSAVLSRRDAELACDEGALKRLGDGERAAYGGTLLALVTAKPRPGDLFRCATTMAGDKKSLKERISRIAKAPQRVVWAVVAAVLVTALACVCAFGQAAEPDAPKPSEGLYLDNLAAAAVFSRPEGDGSGDVRITGLGDGYLEWSADTSPGGSILYLTNAGFCCPRLEGKGVEASAIWTDETRTMLGVTMNVNDERVVSGTVSGFYIHFTVELESGTVLKREFESEAEGETLELTDQEMTDMARALAKLMEKAEEFYLNSYSANQEPGSDYVWTMGYFVPDVSDVPKEVVHFVRQVVAEKYNAYETLVNTDEHIKDLGIEFDDYRIRALQGPWAGTACGMDLEVWRIDYEFHTTTPKEAENLIVGGNDLTEDGWLRPTYPNSTYVIFVVNDAGKRGFLTSIMYNMGGPSENEAESAGFFQHFYPYVAQVLVSKGLADPNGLTDVDLNRNGVPETILTSIVGGGEGQRVEVWEDGKLLWSDEGYYAHVGWNAVFLYRDGGGDYLLRYHPAMYQGYCTYRYQMFTLSKTGEEQVKREDGVDFDVNFQPLMHESFDPEEIAAFMEEVNVYLDHSVQLLNTDQDLLDTFEKEGRLYDSLGWLDNWEPVFVWDGYKPLVENLRAYQKAMEAEWYAVEPTLFVMNETEENAHVWLRYQDRSTQFDVDYWDWKYQPAEWVELQVVDLNHDGRDEIVFPLVWGHGTGGYIEKLYVFDAETLEQYDTSGLNDMVVNSIRSTGDEEWFYLQGPGMTDPVSLKKEAPSYNPDAPVADVIGVGDIIQYEVSDGAVSCFLLCDSSGMLLGYEGYMQVWLDFTAEGSFRCVNSEYGSALTGSPDLLLY